jgi:hypothetical protein
VPHSFTLSLNNVSMLKGSYDRRKGPGKNQGAPPDPRHFCCKFSREIARVRGPFAFQPRCSHRTSAVRPVWNLGPQHFSYQFSHKLPLVSYMFMCISPAHAHRKTRVPFWDFTMFVSHFSYDRFCEMSMCMSVVQARSKLRSRFWDTHFFVNFRAR